jgi:hypothetical protein
VKADPENRVTHWNLAVYGRLLGRAEAEEQLGAFLDLLDAYPPQSRLTYLRAAASGIWLNLERRPEDAPQLLALLAPLAVYLDGMEETEGSENQIAAIFACFGHLALFAGDPVQAEGYLRQSLDLAPRQPRARLWLALAWKRKARIPRRRSRPCTPISTTPSGEIALPHRGSGASS